MGKHLNTLIRLVVTGGLITTATGCSDNARVAAVRPAGGKSTGRRRVRRGEPSNN